MPGARPGGSADMQPESGPDHAYDSHWHLDKKVPVGIIVVLLGYGIAGMWFVADIKKDVEILKAATSAQAVRDDRQDRAVADGVTLLRNDMAYIRQQLDMLIRDGSARKPVLDVR